MVNSKKKDYSEKLKAERKQYLKIAENREKKFKRRLQEFFMEQKKAILKNLKEKKDIKVDDITSGAENEEGLKKIFLESYRENIKDGVSAIAMLLGSDEVNVFGRATVKSFLATMPQRFARKVNETTFTAIKDTLSEGVEVGETIEKLRDRISDVYAEASKSRAEAIARTEVGRAQNMARLEEMKALGAEKRVWMAVFRNTRESHKNLDGKVIGIEEKFDVGGYKAHFPNDPSLPAHESVNCQCSVAPVVDD
jgi:SPP1 gp7 family putative phage head morphogenesis protein